MAILGNTLREKREALGLSTQEVSETLEIQERFIKALEEEKLDIIPNEYYIKAFMKQYGDFLKINGDKLLATFYKEQDQLIKEQEKRETIQKEQESLAEESLVDEEQNDLNQLENLKIQQEAENLSNIDKPTEISLHISDYEYEESLKNMPNKKKFNKGIFVWPIIILLGIGLAYLVHAALNLGGTKTPVVVETTTTTQETTSAQETTTVETTTTQETTESTTETTTTTQETTQETTVQTTPVQTTTTQQEYPSGNNLIYVKSAQGRSTTYGLGSDYKNYTGNYNFKVTVTEPTWISVIIHNQLIYEGTITSQYTFHSLNTAYNVIVKTGVSSATKITMNGIELNVPTTYRVHTVEVDLKR